MEEWLLGLPASVKIGTAFIGILAVNGVGLTLGLSILLFSIVLSVWSGTGMSGLEFQIASFALPENYMLPVVVAFLLLFVEALQKTGRIERTVKALQGMFQDKRALFAGLPALIGMLPMPGGALFSAPLVASVDDENNLFAPEKAAINYWFRHIWEYWWPMYPGVILAVKYSGLSFTKFMALQLPFTVASLAGGYLFLLRNGKIAGGSIHSTLHPKKGDIFSGLGPILFLVGTTMIGTSALSVVVVSKTAASLLAMIAGLGLSISIVLRGDKRAFVQSFSIFKRRNLWLMLLLVVGVQAFSNVLKCPLDAGQNTMIVIMRNEFVKAGIPVVLIIMLMPFLSGLATGLSFGFVGASFPIVFALIGDHPAPGVIAAVTSLAYSSGYLGMMFSPLHVCFVVTCEYYSTRMAKVYRYLAGPSWVVLITALFLSAFYYKFL
jgi:uncharacterized protein